MTVPRDPVTLHGAIQAAIAWAGSGRAALAAGVSEARLRQVSNPNRRDADLAHVLVGLDAACAKAGGGTPVFDWMFEQLSQAGAVTSQHGVYAAAGKRGPAVVRVLAAQTIAGMRALLEELERLLLPPAALAKAG